ncbi:hypothetical protein SBADM41S_04896 [Streptomyces badius]
MSQSQQQPALPKCPGCEEPPAAGDLFCGACGYDLSAVPARPGDRPTVPITVPLGSPEASAAPAARTAEAVRWPAAPETDSSDVPAPVHRPSDLPGTDSGGRPLAEQEREQVQKQPQEPGVAAGQGASVGPGPGPEPVGGPEPSAAAVRHDDRAAPDAAEHSGDFALAAPDPRTAEHAAAPAAPAAGGRSVWPAAPAGWTPTATARTAGTPSPGSATTWSRSSTRWPR